MRYLADILTSSMPQVVSGARALSPMRSHVWVRGSPTLSWSRFCHGAGTAARVRARADDEDRQRRDRREAIAAGQAARRMEREADAQRIRLEAEEYTKGYLVTVQGRVRGIADEEVLTGREEVFIRYATPEAKAYFAEQPRPTAAYFRGRDTRIPYSDRPMGRRTRALGWAPPRAPSRPRRATRALGWGGEREAG
jgi:hypothetical protein